MAFNLDHLKHTAKKDLDAVVFSLGHALGLKQTPVEHEQKMHASPEAQALFDVKKTILQQVRDTAANSIDPVTGKAPLPSIEDYRLASEAFSKTDHGRAMVAEGKWKPAIAADLSGQDLSGFMISEPKKISPTKEMELAAAAQEAEKKAVRGPDTVDIHDRDGDGQINSAPVHDFYNHVRFDAADLHGAWVEPATSFNEEIAKAKNLEGMTFNGMENGDQFVFDAGQYKDVRMTNINVNDKGGIVFADNSHVDGISIEGSQAKITLGDHASVNHVEVKDNFRIISLDMGKNSVISNSDLGESTVSMHSHFEPGATFKNVQLSANVQGLDFTGLKLHNVTIGDTPITHADQLTDYGVTHDRTTSITNSGGFGQEAAPEHAAATQQAELDPIAQIRAQHKASLESIGKPLNDEALAKLDVIKANNQVREQQSRDFVPPMPGSRNA